MIPNELFSKRCNASKNPRFKNAGWKREYLGISLRLYTRQLQILNGHSQVLEFNWAIHDIVHVSIPEIHNGG